MERARPNLIIKSAAVLLRRIISQQFLRALKTHVPIPFSCKRFNRPIAISRESLASVRFDSASLPWRAKRKRGTQLSLGSADRTDLQRPYLNYSEKLITFFLPSPPPPSRGNPLNVSASDVDLAFKENLGMRTTVQSRRRPSAPAE